MEGTRWTDDLLDRHVATVDEKLGHLHNETESLRREMNAGFAELRGEMHDGFAHVRGELAGIRVEMAADRAQVAALHRQVMAVVGGFGVGLLGLLAVVVAML